MPKKPSTGLETIVIAKVLVIDAHGDVLVLRRSKTHPTLALRRDVPGGQVEAGESPAEGVVREVQEETGLLVRPADMHLVYSMTEAWDDLSRVRVLYATKLPDVQPKVTTSWEHDQAEWLSLDDILAIETEFTPFYTNAIQYLREHDILGRI